jgi:hypothetical protein
LLNDIMLIKFINSGYWMQMHIDWICICSILDFFKMWVVSNKLYFIILFIILFEVKMIAGWKSRDTIFCIWTVCHVENVKSLTSVKISFSFRNAVNCLTMEC